MMGKILVERNEWPAPPGADFADGMSIPVAPGTRARLWRSLSLLLFQQLFLQAGPFRAES